MLHWTRSLVAVVVVALVSCGDNAEGPPDAPPQPACSDGRDNDHDGLIDFPEDPGCISATADDEAALVKPQCSDNRDNDGDGLKDYPDDPGCLTPEVDDERDDCPDGPHCPQCSNAVDDDASGMKDFPLDPGCESAADNFEYGANPDACGAGLVLKQLPPTGKVTGMLDSTSVSNISTPCGGGNGVPAIGYVMVLNKPYIVTISTAGSFVDTVLDLRRPTCMDAGSALECNDNAAASSTTSLITRSLTAGVYYIIVEGKTATQTGPYVLTVTKYNGEGEECDMQSDCGPGLVCRIPVGGTKKICTRPVCSDGIDDDGDGAIDYPNDPGCSFPDDNDETDACPNSPSCPKCSDGIDNDGDGATDYPLDESCKAAGDGSEACITSEKPIRMITTGTVTGTTVGAVNDHDPTCNSSTGVAPDVLYRIDLPAMSRLNLNLNASYDSVHSLLDATCGGAPISCSDPALMTVNNLAAGTYYVSIDAWSTASGTFTLTTSGTIAPGGSCESVLFQSGAITCEPGFACEGPIGARTCLAQCSDGIDNNGDGKTDYPNDPGCSAPNDNVEDTVCPGATCPACSDGIDNDGDGKIDYPNDTTCRAASGTNEQCATSEPIAAITTKVTNGTTVGAVDDYDPTCNSSTGLAPDVLYQIDVPTMASLTLDVAGFDTVTTVLNSTCGGTPLRCSDPQSTTLTNLAAGRYYIGIEGYFTASSPFTLTTTGTVVPGESCEGALFQSGAFTCTSGYACDGPAGARTCRPNQCSDGIDNNGDGKIDYPSDPGCSSTNDPTEDTVCPGPMCPACSDGIDNDGDGKIDYPADSSCKAASGATELCTTSEPIGMITTKITTGTTIGAIDDYDPTCNSSSGLAPDVLYQIDLPAMTSLTLDVSGFDTVTTLLNSTCGGTPIQCSDPAVMTVPNLAAGTYFVGIEGWSTTTGAFTLTTSGTIAPGGSCEGTLYQNGVIACAAGYACVGPAGARKCNVECADGVDNNGDGKIDYPNDPGCTSASDPTEDTVCPGAMCPVCSNGMDDDGDGLVDWPADFACTSAAGGTEVFCPSEPDYRGAITMPVTAGTLAAPATDHHEQTCQTDTGNDVVYSLSSPVPASWVISTEGSTIADTVLSLYDPGCAAAPLACDDDSGTGKLSQISMSLPAGNYAIQVDSYTQYGNNGPFLLNVRGTARAGSACTSPLFASGVLVCPTGQTCTAGVCK